MNNVRLTICIVLACYLAGCGVQQPISRQSVSDTLQHKTGFNVSKNFEPGTITMPPTVNTKDGITEEEAVSIALWNNPQFQADLAAISITQADVIEASIVSNPILRYLAPGGGLQASGYINFAFDFLFQRPKRMAASKLNAEQVAETTVSRGFTLIRDVQNAYTDLLLAKQRAIILDQNALVRREMADIANSRLRNGDISELEAITFRADSASAKDELVRATLDTLLKKNGLNVLLGFSPDTNILLQPTTFNTDTQQVILDNYLQLAYQYQPELKAAEINIHAIGKRLGWEKTRIIAFVATLNFQHSSSKGGSKWLPNSANPGLQLEIPVLNRNQGRIARAKADLESAIAQYYAARQRTALDASSAFYRYKLAWDSYTLWKGATIPALQEAVQLAQSSYLNGDISYLPVLEAQRQLLNARLRQADIQAEIRKAISSLNFSLGQKWNN